MGLVQGLEEFLLNQLDLLPSTTMRTLAEQAQATNRPPISIEEILASLRRTNASRFADAALGQLWRVPPEPGRRSELG